MGRRRSNWRLPDEPISHGSCFQISSEVVKNFDISTTPALIGTWGGAGQLSSVGAVASHCFCRQEKGAQGGF